MFEMVLNNKFSLPCTQKNDASPSALSRQGGVVVVAMFCKAGLFSKSKVIQNKTMLIIKNRLKNALLDG